MLFALICKDKPGHLATRLENRDAHLAYAADHGRTKFAGPFLTDEGKMCGSLVVIDVEDRAAAEAIVAGDPYTKAGLFDSVEITAWKQVV